MNLSKPCQGCQKARLLLRKLGLPVPPLPDQSKQPAALLRPQPLRPWRLNSHQNSSTGPSKLPEK